MYKLMGKKKKKHFFKQNVLYTLTYIRIFQETTALGVFISLMTKLYNILKVIAFDRLLYNYITGDKNSTRLLVITSEILKG